MAWIKRHGGDAVFQFGNSKVGSFEEREREEAGKEMMTWKLTWIRRRCHKMRSDQR